MNQSPQVLQLPTVLERTIPTPEQLLAAAPASGPTWLIEDILPEQSVTLLAGAPASFKWWLAWDLARHVAAGAAWLTCQVTPAPVLYIDLENPAALIMDRFRTWPAFQPARLHYWGKWQEPRFIRLNPRGARVPDECDITSSLLFDYAADARPLIVFDSLIRLHPENESDNQRMAPIMQCFDNLAQAGATVVLLHHLSHEGNPRGASEIQCAPDVVYKVRREQLRADLIAEKNRYTPEIALALRWTPQGFARRPANDWIATGPSRPRRPKRAPAQPGLF